MSSYPGGKGKGGAYQRIISMMPPHKVYIEAFLGNGYVLRNKRPAEHNVGIEIDKQVLKDRWNGNELDNLEIINSCGISLFHDLAFNKKKQKLYIPNETLIYCDPPYLKSVRLTNRQIYRYDMMSEDEHFKFIQNIRFASNAGYKIMISGYDSELYNRFLPEWRKESFISYDRGSNERKEIVWLNFPKPLELHDYSHLGDGYRERERIKRKRQRWKKRLERMNDQEMFALMATIEEFKLSMLAKNNDVRS